MIEQSQYKHLDSIKTLHCEEIGSGVFYVSELPSREYLVFTFKDEYGIFNIFPNMGEVFRYASDDLECERVCIDDDYFEEDDPRYEEGVDAMDMYLNSLVESDLIEIQKKG